MNTKQEKASILENSYHCDDVELKERRSLINLYRMRERAVFKEETRKEMKYSEE